MRIFELFCELRENLCTGKISRSARLLQRICPALMLRLSTSFDLPFAKATEAIQLQCLRGRIQFDSKIRKIDSSFRFVFFPNTKTKKDSKNISVSREQQLLFSLPKTQALRDVSARFRSMSQRAGLSRTRSFSQAFFANFFF